VHRPEASAARTLDAKKGFEEAGRIETRRRGIEKEENDSADEKEQGSANVTGRGCHADAGAHCLSEASLRPHEEGARCPSDARPHCLSEASLRAKEEGCRPHDSSVYMIAVGGAGSSAAPAFESGTKIR
jgi:hypothetical protein